jgi:hypothetical protein
LWARSGRTTLRRLRIGSAAQRNDKVDVWAVVGSRRFGEVGEADAALARKAVLLAHQRM